MRGMNKLPSATRVQILSMLCEGSSMNSIARVADVSPEHGGEATDGGRKGL